MFNSIKRFTDLKRSFILEVSNLSPGTCCYVNFIQIKLIVCDL